MLSIKGLLNSKYVAGMKLILNQYISQNVNLFASFGNFFLSKVWDLGEFLKNYPVKITQDGVKVIETFIESS